MNVLLKLLSDMIIPARSGTGHSRPVFEKVAQKYPPGQTGEPLMREPPKSFNFFAYFLKAGRIDGANQLYNEPLRPGPDLSLQ